MSEREGFSDIEADMVKLAAKMGPAMQTYWNYSRIRFRHQSLLVQRLLALDSWQPPIRLLDVGPSFQTRLFERMFGPELHIDTFGFTDPKFPPPPGGVHIAYDLNDSVDETSWPKVEPYHLITFFEVIEHLYTSPTQVLRCLRSLLRPGGLLAVSTPNALALQNRLKLLLGHHPFERIRENRGNPGHFRESTLRELQEMGAAAGLETIEASTHNLASTGSLESHIFRTISPVLPRNLRKELSIVYRNK
jgi:hypothetical protein